MPRYTPLNTITKSNIAATFPVNFVNNPIINKIPKMNSSKPKIINVVSAGKNVIILSTGGLEFKNNLPIPEFRNTTPKPIRIKNSDQFVMI